MEVKMELLLSQEKVKVVVTEPKPEVPDNAWLANDEKARVLIGLSLNDSQLIHVMQTNTSKEMWDELKSYHKRSSLSSKIHVMRKMFATKMPEGGNIDEHIKELSSLRLRLIALGEEMKDSSFVALMLSSLPRSYDGLIVALESRPDADLTLDFVEGKLLGDGSRRADGAEEEKALFLSGGDKTKIDKQRENDVTTGR
uniref:Uncharacterized protein n=1 Tax=Anopheles stephensi TaxID=30069 RepID=A0A182YRC1_ANOST